MVASRGCGRDCCCRDAVTGSDCDSRDDCSSAGAGCRGEACVGHGATYARGWESARQCGGNCCSLACCYRGGSYGGADRRLCLVDCDIGTCSGECIVVCVAAVRCLVAEACNGSRCVSCGWDRVARTDCYGRYRSSGSGASRSCEPCIGDGAAYSGGWESADKGCRQSSRASNCDWRGCGSG